MAIAEGGRRILQCIINIILSTVVTTTSSVAETLFGSNPARYPVFDAMTCVVSAAVNRSNQPAKSINDEICARFNEMAENIGLARCVLFLDSENRSFLKANEALARADTRDKCQRIAASIAANANGGRYHFSGGVDPTERARALCMVGNIVIFPHKKMANGEADAYPYLLDKVLYRMAPPDAAAAAAAAADAADPASRAAEPQDCEFKPASAVWQYDSDLALLALRWGKGVMIGIYNAIHPNSLSCLRVLHPWDLLTRGAVAVTSFVSFAASCVGSGCDFFKIPGVGAATAVAGAVAVFNTPASSADPLQAYYNQLRGNTKPDEDDDDYDGSDEDEEEEGEEEEEEEGEGLVADGEPEATLPELKATLTRNLPPELLDEFGAHDSWKRFFTTLSFFTSMFDFLRFSSGDLKAERPAVVLCVLVPDLRADGTIVGCVEGTITATYNGEGDVDVDISHEIRGWVRLNVAANDDDAAASASFADARQVFRDRQQQWQKDLESSFSLESATSFKDDIFICLARLMALNPRRPSSADWRALSEAYNQSAASSSSSSSSVGAARAASSSASCTLELALSHAGTPDEMCWRQPLLNAFVLKLRKHISNGSAPASALAIWDAAKPRVIILYLPRVFLEGVGIHDRRHKVWSARFLPSEIQQQQLTTRSGVLRHVLAQNTLFDLVFSRLESLSGQQPQKEQWKAALKELQQQWQKEEEDQEGFRETCRKLAPRVKEGCEDEVFVNKEVGLTKEKFGVFVPLSFTHAQRRALLILVAAEPSPRLPLEIVGSVQQYAAARNPQLAVDHFLSCVRYYATGDVEQLVAQQHPGRLRAVMNAARLLLHLIPPSSSSTPCPSPPAAQRLTVTISNRTIRFVVLLPSELRPSATGTDPRVAQQRPFKLLHAACSASPYAHLARRELLDWLRAIPNLPPETVATLQAALPLARTNRPRASSLLPSPQLTLPSFAGLHPLHVNTLISLIRADPERQDPEEVLRILADSIGACITRQRRQHGAVSTAGVVAAVWNGDSPFSISPYLRSALVVAQLRAQKYRFPLGRSTLWYSEQDWANRHGERWTREEFPSVAAVIDNSNPDTTDSPFISYLISTNSPTAAQLQELIDCYRRSIDKCTRNGSCSCWRQNVLDELNRPSLLAGSWPTGGPQEMSNFLTFMINVDVHDGWLREPIRVNHLSIELVPAGVLPCLAAAHRDAERRKDEVGCGHLSPGIFVCNWPLLLFFIFDKQRILSLPSSSSSRKLGEAYVAWPVASQSLPQAAKMTSSSSARTAILSILQLLVADARLLLQHILDERHDAADGAADAVAPAAADGAAPVPNIVLSNTRANAKQREEATGIENSFYTFEAGVESFPQTTQRVVSEATAAKQRAYAVALFEVLAVVRKSTLMVARKAGGDVSLSAAWAVPATQEDALKLVKAELSKLRLVDEGGGERTSRRSRSP